MNKHSEFIKKCLDDPESVTQEELQDNYDVAIKKYYAAREGRLYKLFNGSDTAVWAHDEIIKQDKRIAELEKERDDFEALNSELYSIIFTHLGWWDLEGVNEIDHDDIIKALCAQYERIAELEKLINNQIFPSMGDGFSGDYISGYEKALADMCKALKEQGE